MIDVCENETTLEDNLKSSQPYRQERKRQKTNIINSTLEEDNVHQIS